jgi:sec-independent protein translocase protein TatC
MILTPPDIISQTLLAVPVYLLYELGILMARMFSVREKESGEEAQPG